MNFSGAGHHLSRVAGKMDAAELAKGIKGGGGNLNLKTVEGGTLTAKMDSDRIAIMTKRAALPT